MENGKLHSRHSAERLNVIDGSHEGEEARERMQPSGSSWETWERICECAFGAHLISVFYRTSAEKKPK
jgi:hypothetical protein